MSYTPEILLLELVDKRPSGWIQEGTENTAFPIEIDSPTTSWIANTSIATVEDEEIINGEKRKVRKNIATRYIKGCDTILKNEQEKNGFVPSRTGEDRVVFVNGFLTLAYEGSGIELTKFLTTNNLYNDYPLRPSSVKPLFQKVKIDETAQKINEQEELRHDAMSIIFSLRVKGKGSETVYNVSKIDALCEHFGVPVIGEPETKLHALSEWAKMRPAIFIAKVSKFENQIESEISAALQYGIIKINNTVVEYANDSKVVKTFGSEKLKKEEVITKLNEYLMTAEGSQDLAELRIALEVAKENALKAK